MKILMNDDTMCDVYAYKLPIRGVQILRTQPITENLVKKSENRWVRMG